MSLDCFLSVVTITVIFKYSLWNARTNTEGYNLHISEWEFIIKYHGLLLLNLILPTYHGIIGIPKSPFISAYENIAELFLSRSPFISARLCITALSVLPYHRLFRFCQNITASVFISYHRISRDSSLYRLDHLSGLFSYFNLRCIMILVSSPVSRLAKKFQLIVWRMPRKAVSNSAHEAIYRSNDASDIASRKNRCPLRLYVIRIIQSA